MVIRWVTRSSWPQQDGCPRHAMLRVIPSQCLGIMPGFHVPDGLDNVKIKIQERLPVRCPLPTGHIGGPWIIWFMRILKSMVSYRRLWVWALPRLEFQLYSQNPVSALGAPTVTSDGLTSPVLARFQRKSWVTLCSWSQFHVLQLDYSVWIINYFKKVSENLSRNCLKNYQEHIWKLSVEN